MGQLLSSCSQISSKTERTFKLAGAAESDLTIHCDDYVFHVHRSLLSMASPVWDRMLNGYFAESTSSIISFEEDCPRALNYVLEILYYPEEFSMQSVRDRGTTEVEEILDKYQLIGVITLIPKIKANVVDFDRLRGDIDVLAVRKKKLQTEYRCVKNKIQKVKPKWKKDMKIMLYFLSIRLSYIPLIMMNLSV